MRPVVWAACSIGVALLACAAAPPPPPPPPVAQTEEPAVDADDEPDAAAPGPGSVLVGTVVTAPEPSRPPATSYDEAISTPESLNPHDDHLHLTDLQLSGPMRGVLNGCRVPSTAKVTLKIAVQNGRAIGVTIDVRFVRRRSTRPPSAATARAEAKAAARIVSCGGRHVRALTWPPSQRRDTFTTEF